MWVHGQVFKLIFGLRELFFYGGCYTSIAIGFNLYGLSWCGIGFHLLYGALYRDKISIFNLMRSLYWFTPRGGVYSSSLLRLSKGSPSWRNNFLYLYRF
jgi:hypothetical protein